MEVDVFDREGAKSHARLLTTASACQQLGNGDPIDLFYTRSKNILSLLRKACLLIFTYNRTATVASLKRENSHRTGADTVVPQV